MSANMLQTGASGANRVQASASGC